MMEAAIERASRKSSAQAGKRHQHDKDHADGGERQHILTQSMQHRLRRQVAGRQNCGAHRGPPLKGVVPGEGFPCRGCAGACRGFAGPAIAQFGLDALPVEVGQNRSHGGVKIGWYRLAHLDGAIKRASQRRVLDDRHAGPPGLGFNLFGEKVPSFGHHAGRFHGGKIEAQGDGVVGGIGEHDGGLGDIVLDAAAPGLALQVANAAANLRTALCLLELVAHVLLAHLEARFAALPFDQVIDGRPAEEQPGRGQQQSVDVRAQRLKARNRKRRNRELPCDALDGEDGQQAGRKQRLGQARRGAQREEVLDI